MELILFVVAPACLWVAYMLPRAPARLSTALLDHLVVVSRQGLALAPSLRALARELSDQKQAKDAEQIRELAAWLESEGSLGVALGRLPGLFPPLWTRTLAEAEVRGALAECLERLRSEEETRVRWLLKLREWLAYPGVATFFCFGVLLFTEIVVLPKFREIAQAMGTQGPQQSWTSTALALAAVFQVGLLGSLSVGFGTRWERPRSLLVGALYRVPGLGSALRRHALGGLWMDAAASLRAGATWVETLRALAEETPGPLQPALREAAEAAARGAELGEVLGLLCQRDPRGLATLLLTLQAAPTLAQGLEEAGQRSRQRAERRLSAWGEALRVTPIVACAVPVACQALVTWNFLVQHQVALVGGVY